MSDQVKRKLRNGLLRDSDWTHATDSPLSAEQKLQWAQYRQELRDLPSDPSWPNVEIPAMPEAP